MVTDYKVLKLAWIAYLIIVAAMFTVSIITGRRASALAGSPHYLLTRTTVFVEKQMQPESETEAALDALFEEAGEPATRTVEEPVFVLGLLDATVPVSLFGLFLLLASTLIARRRRSTAGKR